MNKTEDPSVQVYFDGEPAPTNIKPTLIDWAKYYIFNLYRKPMVWKKQKELLAIFKEIKGDLDTRILPKLWENRIVCNQCYDAYKTLKPQVFLSQIELILKCLKKDYDHIHWPMFDSFLSHYQEKLRDSEEISAWINGFR